MNFIRPQSTSLCHIKRYTPRFLNRKIPALASKIIHRIVNSSALLHPATPSARSSCGVQTCRLTTHAWQRLHSQSASDRDPTIHCKTQETQQGQTVAYIKIANPTKLNVVNTALLDELIATCQSLSTDPTLRAVILTGDATPPEKAPAFIGGADINEMYRLTGPSDARQFITRIHLACAAIRDLPVPVIARVHGYCLGAGLEIMASCDLRVASEKAVFGMPEVKVGIPSVVEAALLPGLIGMGRTRRLLYLAGKIDARQAEAWGLVECVVSGEPALDEVVRDWAGKICASGAKAIREQKRLMQRWEDCTISEGIEAGIDSFAKAYEDGGLEPKSLMGQFLNKSSHRR